MIANLKIAIRIFRNISFVFLFFLLHELHASTPVSVIAAADTNKIKIGEQFHLNFSATTVPGQKIDFPLVPDTFNHFEVVSKSTIDTLREKDKKEITLRQQLTMTCFDSGFFVIPPMTFLVHGEQGKTDSLLTEAMLMSVVTVAVDTTKEIRPLKNILEVPFPWLDYLIYLLIAIVVGVLIYYLAKKFKKREIKIIAPVIHKRPAHELALEALRKIEDEKLWQQGLTKKYYSEVTDVIRLYIERRFDVFAMEQTTDEILKHFENDRLKDEDKEKLRYMLRLADMVKFAKALPLPTENESLLKYAYDFINDTRSVVKEDITKEIKEEEVK